MTRRAVLFVVLLTAAVLAVMWLVWPEPVAIEVLSAFPSGLPRWFRWHGREHRVVHGWGPERIETGWWRGADIGRDYYVVTTEAGCRLWLFRRRDGGAWFLHGCFD